MCDGAHKVCDGTLASVLSPCGVVELIAAFRVISGPWPPQRRHRRRRFCCVNGHSSRAVPEWRIHVSRATGSFDSKRVCRADSISRKQRKAEA